MMNAPNGLPAPVDYTDLDYASLLARLRALMLSVFPDLDLDTATELALLLIQGKAYVGDVLAFYLRKAGREARITTATQRKSLYGLAKLIGYRPRLASAATALEAFTCAPAPTGTLTLKRGQLVRTEDVVSPVSFQLLADLVFAAGQTSANADVENSVFVDELFESSGLANQRITLAKTPFLDGSAIVTAANGGFLQVDNFLESSGSDRHFLVVVDQLDRCTIVFGNGINGAIPSGDIDVTYKTGGGAAGNVPAGALKRIDGSFVDSLGHPVIVSCTNALKADGGLDRASIEEIRQLAPLSLRVLGRAVANEDYEIVALGVGGVARALMLTADEDAAIPENSGWLFVVPTGGGTPTQTLVDTIRSKFEQVLGYPKPTTPKPNAFPLQITGASLLTIDVAMTIYLRARAAPAVVAAAVRANFATFFAPKNPDGSVNNLVNFGQYLQDVDGNPSGFFAYSDLFDVAKDTTGILRVDPGPTGFTLNGKRADVAIQQHQFPVLGTITIIDGNTGAQL